ncbi:D-aminoacylase [Ditylenchus destructor]|uniref:D-aminoacylase n=1 Tax=Ditylenchus destructor TaxID=166010 RepID=A0AAD4MFH1_9BILA|nr:D-aminoacylase [Ditylenchus destructor]
MAGPATPSGQQQQQHHLLLLRGGTVIDGSGAPPRRADLLVEGDTIADILPPGAAGVAGAGIVELGGLSLAPGFIDSHTHDDGYLLAHPDMVPKVSQGVTRW